MYCFFSPVEMCMKNGKLHINSEVTAWESYCDLSIGNKREKKGRTGALELEKAKKGEYKCIVFDRSQIQV